MFDVTLARTICEQPRRRQSVPTLKCKYLYNTYCMGAHRNLKRPVRTEGPSCNIENLASLDARPITSQAIITNIPACKRSTSMLLDGRAQRSENELDDFADRPAIFSPQPRRLHQPIFVYRKTSAISSNTPTMKRSCSGCRIATDQADRSWKTLMSLVVRT